MEEAAHVAGAHGNVTTSARWSSITSMVHRGLRAVYHNAGQRLRETTLVDRTWRETADTTFAANPNVRVPWPTCTVSSGARRRLLFRMHGSPHAEYPTLQANDSVYPTKLRGYLAKITECSICHSSTLATTGNGGPHGLHTVGQAWVDFHHDYVDSHGSRSYLYVLRGELKGLALSAAKVARTFNGGDYGTKTFPANRCYVLRLPQRA